MSTLYENDFHEWCIVQENLLKNHNIQSLDFLNLAEEISSMGRSERNQLANRLTILISHLFKWKYQPSHRGNSWAYTIEDQKTKIQRLINKNPSLNHYYQECLTEAIEDARRSAAWETGLKLEIFPEEIDLKKLTDEYLETRQN